MPPRKKKKPPKRKRYPLTASQTRILTQLPFPIWHWLTLHHATRKVLEHRGYVRFGPFKVFLTTRGRDQIKK